MNLITSRHMHVPYSMKNQPSQCTWFIPVGTTFQHCNQLGDPFQSDMFRPDVFLRVYYRLLLRQYYTVSCSKRVVDKGECLVLVVEIHRMIHTNLPNIPYLEHLIAQPVRYPHNPYFPYWIKLLGPLFVYDLRAIILRMMLCNFYQLFGLEKFFEEKLEAQRLLHGMIIITVQDTKKR